MKLKLTYFFVFLSSCFSIAQEPNQFTVKNQIYDSIISQLTKVKEKNSEINFWIDPQTYQFESIDFDEFGLKLIGNQIINDNNYCLNKLNILCKSKIELDNYELSIIYQKGYDHLYPIQFMIYQPLDSWYGLIYQLNKKKYLKNYQEEFEVKIPVKKLFVQDNQSINQWSIIKLTIDQNFVIKRIQQQNL